MRLRILRICELTRQESAGDFTRELLSSLNGARHALRTLRQHNLRTECCGKAAAFQTHRIRHGQDHAVASRGGHKRQPNTGISTRRLYDSAALLQSAGSLSFLHHGQCHAILCGRKRIEGFQLCNQTCRKAMPFPVFFQKQKRRFADQFRNAVCDFHVSFFLSGAADKRFIRCFCHHPFFRKRQRRTVQRQILPCFRSL